MTAEARNAAPPRADQQTVLGPADGYPQPSDRELNNLRRVGRHWRATLGDPQAWRAALPVDPDLPGRASALRPRRYGRFASVGFTLGAEEHEIEADQDAAVSLEGPARAFARIRRAILGPPLRSSAVVQQRMRKLVALPVLSSDALSSVAYGPEAMLAVLALAGAAGLGWSLPIAALIAVLIVIVGVSYRQTIRAYPHGGGSYIVAKDNLGTLPGLFAAAGLMLDYILVVAVSVAAGVAAITSAIPSLADNAVLIGLVAIAVLLAGNLRGVRDAGAIFSLPTYAFIVSMFLVVIVGLIEAAGDGLARTEPTFGATQGLTVLIVLRAFASGATAMTGIEAISDGVPAFEPVEWRNARSTLAWMVALLVTMFAGTMFLMHLRGIVPSASHTALSQLAEVVFHGTGVLYVLVQVSTAAILLLAANTAYSDFPRLLFFLARDYHLPRLFLRLDDRLAFSGGILALTAAAAVLFVAFGGNTKRLIPLFAVGVFLAFTLSQAAMVQHWRTHRGDPTWRRSMYINGLGAVLTGLVLLVTAGTKFLEGAWIVIILIPLLVLFFIRVSGHYEEMRRAIAIRSLPPRTWQPAAVPGPTAPPRPAAVAAEGDTGEGEESPDQIVHLVVVPVLTLDLATMRTLAYAASLGQPVLAVHLSPDDETKKRFRIAWDAWGAQLPLQLIDSPFRAVVAPLTRYVEALHSQRPDLTLTVLLPELIVKRAWHRILHNGVAVRLRRSLRRHASIVVATVPFHLPS